MNASTLAVAGVLAMSAALPASAQVNSLPDVSSRAATLNLSAFGEARAEPDMASISLGVQTTSATAAQSIADNAAQMNRVIAALRQAGVAEKDVQTSALSLNPQYVYEENKPPRLTGYQAVNQVMVTVNDLKKLGNTVDAVVGAGANTVNGISFGLKDPTPQENEARRKAVRALQAKAKLYAEATGYRLVRLVNLTEGGGAFQPPMPMAGNMMRFDDKESTPAAPGEVVVRIDIGGLYEIGR